MKIMINLSGNTLILVLILILWVLPWKGYALWTASKNNHKWYFIALLVINTLGLFEIIYIFFIAKKTWIDIKNDLIALFSIKKKAE